MKILPTLFAIFIASLAVIPPILLFIALDNGLNFKVILLVIVFTIPIIMLFCTIIGLPCHYFPQWLNLKNKVTYGVIVVIKFREIMERQK